MTVHTAVPVTHAGPVAPPPIAVASLARAMQEPATQQSWSAIAAELIEARAEFNAGCDCNDEVKLGREPTDEEEERYGRLSDRETAALEATLAYEPQTFAALALKSSLLNRREHLELMEDLIGEALARDIARLNDGGPLRNVPWATVQAELAAATAAWEALPDDATEAEDAAVGDAHAEIEVRLERLPAPTLGALVWKLVNALQFDLRAGETTDDMLARQLADRDFAVWTKGVALTDAVTLARVAGEDVALYPRALNARLKLLGVNVRPNGFDAPEGFRMEALALLNTVTDDQVRTLMAAAWIDSYIAAGGGVAMVDRGDGQRVPYFWTDLQPDHDTEQHRLREMLAVREGGNGRLRLSVARLVTEQLAERGDLSCGRAAA